MALAQFGKLIIKHLFIYILTCYHYYSRHSVVPEDKQEDKSTSESDNNSNTNTRPPNPISWLMGNAMGGLAAGRPETLATWPPRASSSSQRNRSSNNNNNRSSGSGNNQNDDSMDIDLD
jgi:hypothetical protein